MIQIKTEDWTSEEIERTKQKIHDLFSYSILYSHKSIDFINAKDVVEEIFGLAYVSSGKHPILTMDTNDSIALTQDLPEFFSAALLDKEGKLLFAIEDIATHKTKIVYAEMYLFQYINDKLLYFLNNMKSYYVESVIKPSLTIRKMFIEKYKVELYKLPEPRDYR